MISKEDDFPRPFTPQPTEDSISSVYTLIPKLQSGTVSFGPDYQIFMADKSQPEVGNLQARVQIFSLSLDICTKQLTTTKKIMMSP